MAYTRQINPRLIKIDANRRKILKKLDQALTREGLTPVETADIRPSGEMTNDALKSWLGENNLASQFVGNFFDTYTPLRELAINVGEKGSRLLDAYTKEWVELLEKKAKKSDKEIALYVINSGRILIYEIYRRLYAEALREDSKLEAGKSRDVWANVIIRFTDLLLKPNQDVEVEIIPTFRTCIGLMHEKWIAILKEAISRIEDMNKAKSVVAANLTILEKYEWHIMRCLIAELVTKSEANESWHSSLSSQEFIVKALEKYENLAIKRLKGEKEPAKNNQVLVIIGTEGNFDKNMDALVNYTDIDMVSIGEISQEWAKRQILICSKSDNERIVRLYGLLNLTKLLRGMVGKIGAIIQYGGWIPLLMEGLKLESLDQMLDMHKMIYSRAVRSRSIDKLEGTKLQQAMVTYQAESASLEVKKIEPFRKLQSEELLENVKEEFTAQFSGLLTYGSLIKCPVVEPKLLGAIQRFLPPSKTPLLTTKLQTSSLKIEEITEEEDEFKDQDTDKELEMTDLSKPTTDKRVIKSTSDSILRSKNIMKTPYIIKFLKARGLLNEVSQLYKDHLERRPLKFLDDFSDSASFTKSSKFLIDLRDCVIKFDIDVTKKIKEEFEGKSLSAPGGYNEKYWELRQEEIFCLKYLCVQSMYIKSDIYLKEFYDEMMSQTQIVVFPNIVGLIDNYNKLYNDAYSLLPKVYAEDYMSLVIPDVSALRTENFELRAALAKADDLSTKLKLDLESEKVKSGVTVEELRVAQEENLKLKNDLKGSDEQKEKLLKLIKGYQEQLEAYKTESVANREVTSKMMETLLMLQKTNLELGKKTDGAAPTSSSPTLFSSGSASKK